MSSPAHDGIVQRRITDNPSEAVVLAVAEIADVDPLDFEQCLNDVIDPDALDNITDWAGDAQVGISFTFESYAVTIEGNELIVENRNSDG